MFADDFVIFDEAHEIPEVAGEHLGLSMSSWAMETSLRRLPQSEAGKIFAEEIGPHPRFGGSGGCIHCSGGFFQHLHVRVLGEKADSIAGKRDFSNDDTHVVIRITANKYLLYCSEVDPWSASTKYFK